MSKRQRKQSTADPPKVKSQITEFFQRNMVESNDGVVQPPCHVDPGGGEVDFQDCELSSPALDECGYKQAETLARPLSCRDVVRTTRSKILAIPMIMFLANIKMWRSALFTTSEGTLIHRKLLCFRSKTQDLPHTFQLVNSHLSNIHVFLFLMKQVSS